MQKIILTSTLLLFFIIQLLSQSLILTDENGTNIMSGATINISGDTGTIITKKLKIINNSSTSKTVKVKKVIIDTITGSENDFCFGGECQIPSLYLSTNSVIIQPSGTDSSFEGGYRPHSFNGTSTISYVFFDINNPTDSVFVNIAYTANVYAGIVDNDFTKIDFPAVYPNPASNFAIFSWILPANFNSARIIIRDLVGAIVKEKIIISTTGKTTIEISDLRNGIYFYSLLINETPFVTRKLIIKN